MITNEQKKQLKVKLFADVRRYTDEATVKSQNGQESTLEMFLIKMTLENIEKIDEIPNEN